MSPDRRRAAPNDSEMGVDFVAKLAEIGQNPLMAAGVQIMQLNITRCCNLVCRHCHVKATPDRTEMMSLEVLAECIRIARQFRINTIDITGGSPELHPELPWLLHTLADDGKHTMVRTNLAILLEDRFRGFPELYRDCKVEVVGSLPDYLEERTDRQRGAGTFKKCILALQNLNALGYGREGTGLVLDLAHNPAGSYLPGNQASLEAEYRRTLRDKFNVEFNRLFVLTNCPIGRFHDFLVRSGNLDDYMRMLRQTFNPVAVPNVMCRTMLSVGWDGRLYDCDFNQVLDLPVNSDVPGHVRDFDSGRLGNRHIVLGNHCYACCAGAGSSCQGSLEK